MAESLLTDCDQCLSSTSSSIIYPRREPAIRSMLGCSAFILYLATSLILGSVTLLFATLIWYYEMVLEMIAAVYCSIEQSPLRSLAIIPSQHRHIRNTREANSTEMSLDVDDVPIIW